MNKKAQKMEFAFFALALFISIGAVIIILQLNLPDVTLVGQTTVRAISSMDLLENAKVFTDIVFEQQLPRALNTLIEQKGFISVVYEGELITNSNCDSLIMPVITPDCFPEYTETYKLLLTNNIYSQIQTYDAVNLARNEVSVEINQDYNITTSFLNELVTPVYGDTKAYYGVLQRPGPTSNNLYERTPEGYFKRTGLSSIQRQSNIDTIVMHYTVTKDVDTTYRVLQQAGLSYHYIIDKDGEIYQFVDEDRVAYHAGCGVDGRPGCIPGYNSRSIGISLVSCGYNTTGCEVTQCFENRLIDGLCFEEYTEAQINATTDLIFDISQRHTSLPITRQSVIGHNEIDPRGKVDPGPQFPFDEIIQNVRGRIPLA
jgi:N-acetyl-anhydromuramyl-L-alanine amidase AmpD